MSQSFFPLGSETIVNSTLAGAQSDSGVTALANGGWVVVWTGPEAGGGNGIFQQIFNADGSKKGAETLVNTTVAGHQTYPAVASLPDGGWVVGWSGSGTGTGGIDNEGVFFQVYNADGSKRGQETLANTSTVGDQDGIELTALKNGGWVVTWSGPDSGTTGFDDSGIFQQVFNSDGTKRGSEALVNSTVSGYQAKSSVTPLADGGWVVTWYGGADLSADMDVFQQTYNADGSRRGVETTIHASSSGRQVNSTVTALADGKWVVAWSGQGTAPNNTDISGVYLQVFNADGTPTGGEILVNTTQDGHQPAPSVTALPQGGWVVTWIGPDFGLTAPNIYGDQGIFQQVFNADGSKNGAEIRVSTTTTDQQWLPEVIALSNGDWIVTWSGNGLGDDSGVYMQRYTSGGGIALPLPPPAPSSLVLMGTSKANTLVGAEGNDRLYGKGGKDVLTGNGGQDIFVFDTKANTKTNRDTITDYDVAADTIWLSDSVFKKLGKGTEASPTKLKKAFFKVADKAKDKNDYLVYNKKTGVLSYDADGVGAGKAVEIAKLAKNLKLTQDDFFIV